MCTWHFLTSLLGLLSLLGCQLLVGLLAQLLRLRMLHTQPACCQSRLFGAGAGVVNMASADFIELHGSHGRC